MVYGDAKGNRRIQGAFVAVHGQAKGAVALAKNVRVNSCFLVADNKNRWLRWLTFCTKQGLGVGSGFYGPESVALTFEGFGRIHAIVVLRPGYCLLRPQRRFG